MEFKDQFGRKQGNIVTDNSVCKYPQLFIAIHVAYAVILNFTRI